MTGFSDLSNELILEILRHVPPRNLVLACHITKSISILAAPILEEHRRLEEHYSVIDISINMDYLDQTRYLSELLLQVLAKPRLALYVHHMAVSCWREVDSDDGDGSGSPAPIHPQRRFRPLVKAAIQDTEIIPASEIDKWRPTQDGSVYQVILALLLLHLPELEDLFLFSRDIPLEHLLRMTERINDAPVGMYFSRLETIDITIDPGWEKPEAIKYLTLVMSLPALESCTIDFLKLSDEEHHLIQHLRPRESKVCELGFTACYISEKVLLTFLEYPTSLKVFTCTDPHIYAPQPENWWYGLYLGLMASSSSSLERLTLLTEEAIHTKNFNLRGFTVLQEVELELDLLFNVSDPTVQNFSEMLPPSICIMHLRSLTSQCESVVATFEWFQRIRRAILNLMDTKNELQPQLTNIYLRLYHGAPKRIFRDVPMVCNAAGVLFELDRLD